MTILGTMVVAGGEEQTLTVCELENNELLPVASLRGHERSVECVAVDEASGRIVSGSFDRCIKLWSAQEGEICVSMSICVYLLSFRRHNL